MKLRSRVLVGALLLCGALDFAHGCPCGAGEIPIEGIWTGTLTTSGGPIEVSVTVRSDDGRLIGSLRFLGGGGGEVALDSIHYKSDHIYLASSAAGIVIDGTANLEAGELRTEISQGSEADSLILRSPSPVPGTEVIVIATNHNPTESYTLNDLKGILGRVSPQIVLLEFDSSFFDHSLSFLAEKYWGITSETKVATWYRSQSDAIFRPYDIEGRNEFYEKNRYFERERELQSHIDSLYRANRIGVEAQQQLEIRSAFMSVRNGFQATTGPKTLNSSAFDWLVLQCHRYMHESIQKAIDLTPELADFSGFESLRVAFWDRRNTAMVDNILKYSEEYSGRRIAVLCGNEHAAYLRSGLREQGAGLVSVRNYWDY